MKADAILNADVLDIIFENRNKAYGAYSLRKFYNNRLYKALGLTFAAAALLMLFSFINKGKVEAPLIVGGVVTMSPPPVKADPVPEKPKDKAAPQKTATPKVPPAAQKFTTNLQIIKDNIAPPIEDLNEGLAINNINVVGKPGEAALVTPKVPDAPSGGGDAEVTKPAVDKITPNNVAEVMPSYPGGMEALKKFLEKYLRNPEDLEEGVNVKVRIRFIVGYDGNLKGFETVQDGGTAFNNEVVRVLKKMPQWIPGKTKGENVSVYYTIPVNFIASE